MPNKSTDGSRTDIAKRKRAITQNRVVRRSLPSTFSLSFLSCRQLRYHMKIGMSKKIERKTGAADALGKEYAFRNIINAMR
jgi:hypothetical protein